MLIQPQFLVGDEGDTRRVVLARGLNVLAKLGLDFVEILLAARKVHRPYPRLTLARAFTVAATILAAEWMRGINVFEPFCIQNLRSEALRRRLTLGPLK
jgi:hypothetical protein